MSRILSGALPCGRRASSGFTLVELAISLAILALLLGMLMVPLSVQYDQQRIAETQKQLEQIREAVLGFAIATGRLPCAATPTVATGAAGAGVENRAAGACVVPAAPAEGVIPWITLGVTETDGWGRRFSYRVTSTFADDATGGLSSSFLITDDGNLTVKSGVALADIATLIPAVIVSHGKNGTGAYLSDGTRTAVGVGDELENANGTNTFVSRTHAPDFDDLLVWIPSNILKARMVAAGRLP